MPELALLDVDEILTLHQESVERWHARPIDNQYGGLLELVCRQHACNFELWHEEDIARSPDVGAERIAEAKRKIDRLNQARNDGIEQLDDALAVALQQQGVVAAPDALINSETPGSIIDRLSILSLRIFHMHEQTRRADVNADHIATVQKKLATCLEQRHDLSTALRQLLADIFAGRKRHKTYRQLKMYNDPNLNPYLYQAKKRSAG